MMGCYCGHNRGLVVGKAGRLKCFQPSGGGLGGMLQSPMADMPTKRLYLCTLPL